MSKSSYKQTAKELGAAHLFGRWGIQFFTPGRRGTRLFSIIPLDGWVTDPKEVEHIMRERGFEL